MCETYDVSRITVRKALSELLHEGLIYTSVGRGTYVAPPKLKEALQPLSSFTEDTRRRGMKANSRVLKASVSHADDEQASKLRIPRGAEVVHLYRLRLADSLRIALQQTWLPHHLCTNLLRYDLASRSLYDVLRHEYGLRLIHADTNIVAALAQPEECNLLQLIAPAAVLISEQTTFLDNEIVIEFTRSVFRGDRYTLHTSM